MGAWTVLMDYAKQDNDNRCPYGLVMSVNHGDGVLVERCRHKANHTGAHRAETAQPANYLDIYTHIAIEWYSAPGVLPIWEPKEGGKV
jgi:hypothetical protein